MTLDKLELLAKECAWSDAGVFPMGSLARDTREERSERLYQLGWNDALESLAHQEGVFFAWLRSLDEPTLEALAPLLDDEKAWLRYEGGAVTISLQDGDVDPERVTLEEFQRRCWRRE